MSEKTVDFKGIIAKQKDAASYMVKEITHICKTFGKRDPGSEGEKKACEYMADVLKKDCGCERADVESFKEHPGSFFGWIFYTITLVLLPAFSGNFYRARTASRIFTVRSLQKNA